MSVSQATLFASFCLAVLQLFLIFSLVFIWPSDETKVIFCDVGQGDATLVIDGFTQVLVDAGPDNGSVLQCLAQHLPWFDARLDLFVATHPDLDHIGGAKDVLDRFFVSQLMLVPDAKNTDGFRTFRAAVLREQEMGAQLSFPIQGQYGLIHTCASCRSDFLRYSVVSPLEQYSLENPYKQDMTETTLSAVIEEHERKIKNYNNRSISLFLNLRGVSVLLTGDMEKDTEYALEATGLLTPTTVLKAAHHGAKTSSTSRFLSKIQPEEMIISVGKNNSFGHPSEEVLDRVRQLDSRIWRTDVHGEIRMRISGGDYDIESEKNNRSY